MDLNLYRHPSETSTEHSIKSDDGNESMDTDMESMTSSISNDVTNQLNDEIENHDFITPPSTPNSELSSPIDYTNNTMIQTENQDFNTPPSSPTTELEELICLSGSKEFASHKPKNNWDSLCGSRSFKVMVLTLNHKLIS